MLNKSCIVLSGNSFKWKLNKQFRISLSYPSTVSTNSSIFSSTDPSGEVNTCEVLFFLFI